MLFFQLQQYLSDLRLFMELAECSSGVQKIILRLMSLMVNTVFNFIYQSYLCVFTSLTITWASFL